MLGGLISAPVIGAAPERVILSTGLVHL